mmetsp:Transcript_32802/g.50086  ORF Transcript_32802/g.50086 Transcript_32802/m.50086 type:complete len:81 (+) Transcript_32802:779-1021(+)
MGHVVYSNNFFLELFKEKLRAMTLKQIRKASISDSNSRSATSMSLRYIIIRVANMAAAILRFFKLCMNCSCLRKEEEDEI